MRSKPKCHPKRGDRFIFACKPDVEWCEVCGSVRSYDDLTRKWGKWQVPSLATAPRATAGTAPDRARTLAPPDR